MTRSHYFFLSLPGGSPDQQDTLPSLPNLEQNAPSACPSPIRLEHHFDEQRARNLGQRLLGQNRCHVKLTRTAHDKSAKLP